MRRDEFNLPDPPPNDRPGDRWMCGAEGDSPCTRGPDQRGNCPLESSCHPKRTWHGRRRHFSLIASGIVVAIVLLVAIGQKQADVLKPGDLSSPHAQILDGTLTSQRCEACHPQAGNSPLWGGASAHGAMRVTQSDRCLDCHHRTMDRSTAKLAHNLPKQKREAIRLASTSGNSSGWKQWLPGPAVDQEDVACSACHREHQGTKGSLLDVSDTQCQTCHSQRFGHFATSHPDWGQWPYGRGGEIAFDHASHANKHFPASANSGAPQPFQCATCHPRGSDGELQRSVSFEHGCAHCHLKPLDLEMVEGIDLLTLPSLETEVAARLDSWPATATGFLDGKVSPLADLLIRGDESTGVALRRIPNQDFAQITDAQLHGFDDAAMIARSHRRLLDEIMTDGQQVLIDRVTRLGIKEQTVNALVRTLPPQLVQEAQRRWFIENKRADDSIPLDRLDGSNRDALERFDENAGREKGFDENLLDESDAGLLSDDLLDGGDLLDGAGEGGLLGDVLALDDNETDDPLASGSEQLGVDQESSQFDPDRLLPLGGWYLDDLQASIRYRGYGHDDPVMKAVVELMSQLPQSDRTRVRLLSNRAIRACVQCHPGAMSARPTWTSSALVGNRNQLTKFSHRSHLNIAQLAACTHCHEVTTSNTTELRLVGTATDRREFAPLSKQACVACHVPEAAGDQCTTCHRYHTHGAPEFGFSRSLDPLALER